MASFDYIVGVDEAGRGPLAGPVAVGAVAVPRDRLAALHGAVTGVRESKQLTPALRGEWLSTLVHLRDEGVLLFRCSFSSERTIDHIGIVRATARAAARAVALLALDPSRTLVLLDGLLHAPASFPHQKTIIRGDETETLIALASIVAKVSRDRRMERLAKRYPEYGFEQHKGYGTHLHRECIAQYGLSSVHRESFCKRIVLNPKFKISISK